MTFDYKGYDLVFVNKQLCNDLSDHLFTLVYKFYSPSTKYHYIVHADYHKGDVFAIKFYARPHRFSRYKYSKITNRGDAGNILITCAKCVPLLLQKYPKASFCFAASRTVDVASGRVEQLVSNQRFKIYQYIAREKFGTQIFAHYTYEDISAYLLVSRLCGDTETKEREIVKMLTETYREVPDL